MTGLGRLTYVTAVTSRGVYNRGFEPRDGYVRFEFHLRSEGREGPRGLLSEVVEDGGMERRARDALDRPVGEDDVERDGAESGLPHELAWCLGAGNSRCD